LPVVSTYHAGIPEVVEHDSNGLLVEEGDLPGLAAALGRLIADRGLRERLGRAAAQTALSRCLQEEKTAELEQSMIACWTGGEVEERAGLAQTRLARTGQTPVRGGFTLEHQPRALAELYCAATGVSRCAG